MSYCVNLAVFYLQEDALGPLWVKTNDIINFNNFSTKSPILVRRPHDLVVGVSLINKKKSNFRSKDVSYGSSTSKILSLGVNFGCDS